MQVGTHLLPLLQKSGYDTINSFICCIFHYHYSVQLGSEFNSIHVFCLSHFSQPKKLGFTNFGHLRKKKPDDSADYICPVEIGNSPVLNSYQLQQSFRGLSPVIDKDSSKVDQNGLKWFVRTSKKFFFLLSSTLFRWLACLEPTHMQLDKL